MAENTAGVSRLTHPHPPTSKWLTYVIEGTILLLALVLGLLIRWGIYETALVTSGSMQPTLRKGDRLLIDHRATLRGRWKRGDIVLFAAPPSWDMEAGTWMKRVIGLPGETVEIRAGEVFINGRKLDEPYINGIIPSVELAPDEMPAAEDSMAAMTLGNKQYFVLGDNRNNSDDSRNQGPLDNSYIQGRAVWRIAPLGRMGRLPQPGY